MVYVTVAEVEIKLIMRKQPLKIVLQITFKDANR